MKIIIRRKGGPGSGNWGHSGRPGVVGGSSTSTTSTPVAPTRKVDVDFSAPTQGALDEFLNEFDVGDGDFVAKIAGNLYDIKVESWFPGCMESRDLGSTSKRSIREDYLNIMLAEAGWDEATIHNYLPDAEGSEFGISYIGRLLK